MTRQQLADLIEDYAAAKATGRVTLISVTGEMVKRAIVTLIPEAASPVAATIANVGETTTDIGETSHIGP